MSSSSPLCLLACLLFFCGRISEAFVPSGSRTKIASARICAKGYDETDGTSKGLVTLLTDLVNQFSPKDSRKKTEAEDVGSPPSSRMEVLERLRADYVQGNYLWTGKIDLASFTADCTFQDPTLKFTGRDTFVQNVKNVRRLTDPIIGPCRSELCGIQLCEEETSEPGGASYKNYYVETSWRMVGLFEGLPWKPCIDVPGRTKFWLQPQSQSNPSATSGDCWQVARYEEEWEIPAAQALWQVITPSGVYPEPSEDSGKTN
jgi:hypothetical protein